MSKPIDSGYPVGGNAYPGSLNPAGSVQGANGNPYDVSDLNAALSGNNAPLLGDMQGFGGVDGFSSASPSEQNLSNLLNIAPIQQQADQLSGGSSTKDPSSPLDYVNQTLAPIMSGAQQTYQQAMAGSGQKKTG